MKIIGNNQYTNQKVPKYKKLTNVLLSQIHNGELKIGEKLPSIIDLSLSYGLSRDTVVRCYQNLCDKGVLTSIYRRGYFVSIPAYGIPSKKVLMVISEFNSANFIFYQEASSLMKNNNISCDLKMYDNNLEKLKYLIDEAIVDYHTVIIDSQAYNIKKILELFKGKISANKLILLTDEKAQRTNYATQISLNIEKSFVHALTKLSRNLKKYRVINLVLPDTEYFSSKLINGFFSYCDAKGAKGVLLDEIKEINSANAYLILDEKSLFKIISTAHENHLEISKDIGILALFERPYFKHLKRKVTSLNWYSQKLMNSLIDTINGDFKQVKPQYVTIENRNSL